MAESSNKVSNRRPLFCTDKEKHHHHNRNHQNHKHHCSSISERSDLRIGTKEEVTANEKLLKLNSKSCFKETAAAAAARNNNKINYINSQLHSVNSFSKIHHICSSGTSSSAFKKIDGHITTDWILSFKVMRPFAMMFFILMILMSGCIPATIARPNISITSTQQLLSEPMAEKVTDAGGIGVVGQTGDGPVSNQ